MSCTCFIVPQDVLERLAKDSSLSEELRNASANTSRIAVAAAVDTGWKQVGL
jgi:hypothetical protein